MSIDWTIAIRLLHQGKWSIVELQQFSISFQDDPAITQALQIAVELELALKRASLRSRIEMIEEFSKNPTSGRPHD